MTTIFHPFMDTFAAAQEASIPLWALIEHAAATGAQQFPSASPTGTGKCPRRTESQQPCSSRQAQAQQHGQRHHPHAPRNAGVNCQEYFANAAAIAEALLGGDKSTCPKSKETSTKSGETASVTNTAEGFEIKLDVSNFKPAELNVKTVENFVLIEGKHEERQDAHGFIARSFTRRFIIPEGVNSESVTCKLASNGVLVISASVIHPTPASNERSIPINFSRVPATFPQSAPVAETPIEEEQQKENAVPTDVPMSEDQEVTKVD